ncbi:MAG: hypothetical protein UT18_C0005G0013 [candidate division CPR2 bacterium GW2011_GWC2_39_10]|uniref:TrbL/VirB6 plasmid conjugal transfer protein n=1 Tax=candidate division CPR2 bacterium GW2011_GWC2_39_10 TaxID=1618345 RepID=A0A0G0LST8_UNCC2|nr:MAG: hypothetical protein UT18_C0005G0013 [candidate division CPR2 bacterium GW2011_GWC2_39_10]
MRVCKSFKLLLISTLLMISFSLFYSVLAEPSIAYAKEKTTNELLDENSGNVSPNYYQQIDYNQDCENLWTKYVPLSKDFFYCKIIATTIEISRLFGGLAAYGVMAAKMFVNGVVIIGAGDFEKGNDMYQIWDMTRNVTNGLFGAALIIMAFANMFRVDVKNWDIKVLLPKFLITIVLVNFSWFICRMVVDFANMLAEYAIHINTNITGNAFLSGFDYQKIIDPDAGSVVGGFGASILTALLYLLIFIIGLFLGLYLMLLMAFRVAIIWILVMVAPLAFGMNLLPFTKKMNSQWWSYFSSWVFMGPVTVFLLSIGERIILSFPSTVVMGSLWVRPIMVVVILAAAVSVPQMLGGKIMGMASSQVQGLGMKGKNRFMTGAADGKGQGGYNYYSGRNRRKAQGQAMNKVLEAKHINNAKRRAVYREDQLKGLPYFTRKKEELKYKIADLKPTPFLKKTEGEKDYKSYPSIGAAFAGESAGSFKGDDRQFSQFWTNQERFDFVKPGINDVRLQNGELKPILALLKETNGDREKAMSMCGDEANAKTLSRGFYAIQNTENDSYRAGADRKIIVNHEGKDEVLSSAVENLIKEIKIKGSPPTSPTP